MNSVHTTAATGSTFCGVLEALLVGSKVFQTFLSTVSTCDIFCAVDECSLHLCKYFCKGTDAVKSKQFCGTVIFSPLCFWVFFSLPPPHLGFCIIHRVELILLAERVWNNISHVIFVEEKLFELFLFFWFSLTCIHYKRSSCASSELVQNLLYLYIGLNTWNFIQVFSCVIYALCAGVIFSSLLFLS